MDDRLARLMFLEEEGGGLVIEESQVRHDIRVLIQYAELGPAERIRDEANSLRICLAPARRRIQPQVHVAVVAERHRKPFEAGRVVDRDAGAGATALASAGVWNRSAKDHAIVAGGILDDQLMGAQDIGGLWSAGPSSEEGKCQPEDGDRRAGLRAPESRFEGFHSRNETFKGCRHDNLDVKREAWCDLRPKLRYEDII